MSKDKHDKQTPDMFDTQAEAFSEHQLAGQFDGQGIWVMSEDFAQKLSNHPLLDEEYDENGMVIRGYN